jgi:hypothetical protein
MNNNLYEFSEAELNEFDQLYEGTLLEEEFYVLKAKLQLDEILQHKYLVYKMLRREIENDGLTNKLLKARLTALDQNNRKKQIGILTFSLLSILVIFGFLWFLDNKPSVNTQIYDQYKDSESGISIKMSDDSSNELNEVMIDIAKSNFNVAIEKLNDFNKNDTVIYYLGYCEERLGNDSKAIGIYQTLYSSKSDFIRNKSKFRIGLLHIKYGDRKAVDELTNIASEPANPYAPLAREVLKSIDNK